MQWAACRTRIRPPRPTDPPYGHPNPHMNATRIAPIALYQEVAERLRRAVSSRVAVGGVPVTLSIGVAELAPGMEAIEDWTGAADEALYRAKGDGRDCVRA